MLKTNGWEIGKRDPAYKVVNVNDGQRIIVTGNSPFTTIGTWYDFDIQVNGSTANIYINGTLVHAFVENEAPYFTNGKLGFYGEDAAVELDDVTYPFVDNFDSYAFGALSEGQVFGNWKSVYLSGGVSEIVSSATGGIAVNAACTDLATSIALTNQLRNALIANGICT